ncbi:rho guanine nucleotide exchange factor 7-like isoform X2 [Physella acuta]|uniref:rho guanine nucleotide exchange factor 7-like isoform X2 n=1 Tax=Physella acuta TaxID=109671 RepID=UPI0027DB4132|nr:rho guanine nucleotide exchange factor 7-like isoform X2 [Physella acuta]
MDPAVSSTEYPSDYIDIVNEINDFIASLDAPPLDNHTKELVGNPQRQNTFGNHDAGLSESWTPGSRSRHTSGEKKVNSQLSLSQSGDTSVDVGDKMLPFPPVEDGEPGFSTYDYIGSDRSRSTDFGDYSDLSNYSDVSIGDTDSGCYSHYQHPTSEAVPVSREPRTPVTLTSSCPSHFSSPSHSTTGSLRGAPYLYQSVSSSPRHAPQSFTFSSAHPQSPDRLSAEFCCDPRPDSVDQRFHQVGSSASTLAAASHHWTPVESDYQAPSNIPKVPESPVPQRKSPTKTNPLSTSPKAPDSGCDDIYSSIHKTPQTHGSPQKLNIKNRWPPVSEAELPTREQPQRSGKKVPEEPKMKAEDPTQSRQNPVPIPITRVPDLSVLISELRSASPISELSPNSRYTASARSEAGPALPARSDHYGAALPARPEQYGPALPARPEQYGPALPARPEQYGPALPPENQSCPATPSGHPTSRTLTPSASQPPCVPPHNPPHLANGLRCKSESPEHDYEPIENLQLEVPATPRPQTKFPHPQGQATMAETGGQQPKHVKAIYGFKGTNNDELCFKKGDIITVTQCVEGGWWEGTLNGRTGWFPSNHTKEVKADIGYKNNKTGDVPVYKRESMQLYHNVVLKNVIETEKTHVTEMIKVLQSYIKPIESTNILTTAEYTLLVGNLEEIIAFQQSFLSALEDCEKLPSSQRRIGGIFMQFAPSIQELYHSYCANHPKAVAVLQKKRDELSKFVESQGAPPPGAQTLITILSKPFIRLDKYPSLLKELERHVEESHPDRGDTQRAIAVYRNINNYCLETRKSKEMEHEIVSSVIQGWEGEEISKLGEVIHLSQVKMVTQTGEKFERIFVLFSSCLVMLSMSKGLSHYQYEGKIPLSGLSSSLCENTDKYQNAFEISGPMIEKITVLCGTKVEVNSWLENLNHQLSQTGNSSSKPQSLQVHMIPTCQPNVTTVTTAKTAHITTNPPAALPPTFPPKASSVWSLTCLRPSPPTRPTLMCREEVLKSPRANRKTTHKRKPVRTYSGEETDWHSKNDPKVYNEDAFILQVIEAYCNSVKTRHTVNSCRIEGPKKKAIDGKAILTSPQILLAEDEKIIDESEQQERTVVDTVYALQDRVKELEQEQRRLRLDLDEEKRCRKKLESLIRQQNNKSMDGIQDGT